MMQRIQQITLPSLADPDLAYERGVHIGDGCMQVDKQKHDYRVTFWGCKDELAYYRNTLQPILRRLYDIRNIVIRQVHNEATIYLRICSKQLVIFKHKTLGLPIEKKDQMVSLPRFVTEHPVLLKACISGIFDSDGSLTFLKKTRMFMIIQEFP